MIFNQRSQKSPQKGSWGVAMIFFLIAIAGVILTISSPADKVGSSEIDKPSTEASQTEQFKQTNYSIYLLRVILIMGAIIVVILLGSKWYRKKMRLGSTNRIEMDILSRQYIGPKHSLIILGVEQHKFLLGVSENSINLISEVDDLNELDSVDMSDKAAVIQGQSVENGKEDSNSSFDSVLKKIKPE